MNGLQKSIIYLNGVGPNRQKILKEEFGISTIQDLLNFFPNRYIDRGRFYKINELTNSNSEIQIIGSITKIIKSNTNNKSKLIAKFEDDTGIIELIWFRGHKWIGSNIKIHTPYVIFGKINYFNGIFSMAHPEMELLKDFKIKKRVNFNSVYPSTEKSINSGITQNIIRKMIYEYLNNYDKNFKENLPNNLIEKFNFISKNQAVRNIHFPKNIVCLNNSIERLKFEEFFYLQLQILIKNRERKKKINGYSFSKIGNYFNSFFHEHLSFKLTSAQINVIKEIRKDLGSRYQMNRLLQGDVGSGKTIVAYMSMLISLDNGYQSCLMAPTEILAQQHYKVIKKLSDNIGLTIDILTGSVSKSKRKPLLDDLKLGKIDILIGTHALIEDPVVFKNLGLAIIDEQHRFGVAQRSLLWKKNLLPPNILVMTATPIPRTLAMSLYGDLDISLIDKLPPGRKPIKTFHRTDSKRLSVLKFIKDEISKGNQIYIVYPLIEESKKIDFKDLMDGFESISRYFPLPKYKISILHGKMKNNDKEYEMKRFLEGQTQIMVATTVIEVGVDVPNASVMIIESSERFGLSQLHQLRGRVGRGNKQSYCILMTGNKVSNDSKLRIDTMVKTNNGFEIADVDLKMRGPGNIMGTQQSGLLKLKIADLVKDQDIMINARNSVIDLLDDDENLEKNENQIVKQTLAEIGTYKNIWNYIS
ncbi:MAG: ATP-dependent DNA helicase RecG [Flavobacteriaceae bacterium]|nr:ATP-dependent DNA helicase RecG [Flavobacteriaceae bacterium]|tara:strand:+ start:8857 stop:10956 length:2100 start_codon:yes stop_codon:yes gene_type:complete